MKSTRALLLALLHYSFHSVHVAFAYEWDDWDHYEILGLDRHADYTEKDIKKAYRKQAQQWHPDKVGDNATIEESNERFARIAEAYQVLVNQKQEYDNYLRSRQYNFYTAPGSDPRDTASHHFHEFVDPWSIFEDLFSDLYYYYYDDAGVHSQPGVSGGIYASRNRPPDRIFEKEEILLDHYGRTLVRKTQTASYFDNDHGFMQSVAQEYVQTQQDPYTGDWILQPLHVVPVVLQEGTFPFVKEQTLNKPGFVPEYIMDPSSLWPGVSLVKGSKMRKGSYSLELTVDCDVYISRKAFKDEENQTHLIWSLQESGQMPVYMLNSATDCRFELEGGQLILYIADNAGSILWASEVDREADPHSGSYVARLDADGALAVYRLQTAMVQRPWMSRLWKKTILATDPTSVASVVCELLWSFILGRRVRRVSSEHVTSETCIVAIGSPVGCFRAGRRIVQLFRDAKAIVERVLSFIDHLFDMIP